MTGHKRTGTRFIAYQVPYRVLDNVFPFTRLIYLTRVYFTTWKFQTLKPFISNSKLCIFVQWQNLQFLLIWVIVLLLPIVLLINLNYVRGVLLYYQAPKVLAQLDLFLLVLFWKKAKLWFRIYDSRSKALYIIFK